MPTTLINERNSTADLNQIRNLVAPDLIALDKIIYRELTSNIPLIQHVISHIITSGGKRIRPLIVLLSAKALGYKEGLSTMS